MKRLLLPALLALSIATLGAFAATRSAAAPKKPAAMATHKASGTIVSKSENSVVIKTKKGEEMTFALSDKTAKPSELKEGEMVQIQYLTENGSNMAQKISMSSTAKARSKSKR